MDIPVKPTVLIADDSRIVRATLIKHIEGMFDFREALDGEQAWEILLADPSIRVLITDLTMPKLDGYGLLRRIRSSEVARLREMPVVVVSGSDEAEERERAKAAGATDLITKGIGTAQLLSRLDILSKLVATQEALRHSLETLVREAPADAATSSPDASAAQVDTLFASALKNNKNFVLLTVRVGLRHAGDMNRSTTPPAGMIDAVGRLLRNTVRHADHVSRSGDAEFTLATGGIGGEAAYCFGQRVCSAIAQAEVGEGCTQSLVASCGIVSLRGEGGDGGPITLESMRDLARRRAILGLDAGHAGAVGREEEAVLQRGQALSSPDSGMDGQAPQAGMDNCPDLLTLVRWIRAGKQADVLPYLPKLPPDVRALVELALRRTTY